MTVTKRTPVAVLVLALLLAACGGNGGGGGGGSSDDVAEPDRCPVDALDEVTSPVRITFWHAMGGTNGEVLQSLVDAYNAEQEKVRVTLSFQGTYDETSDKYVTALRGTNLPNIVQLEETRIQLMIDSRSVLPAQACADAAGYDFGNHLPVVLEQFTVDDVLWPMPFNVSNPILFYNTKAFERAGLDPNDPPETLEEIVEASRTIKETGAARNGFAIELSPWYVEQWFAMAGEHVVDTENGRAGRANAATLDNEIGLEVYEFLKGLVDEGLALNTGRNPSGQDHLVALGTGDAAMTIGTSAAIGGILDVLATGQFPDVGFGASRLPGPTAEGGGVLVGGASLYLVEKAAAPEEIAASWDFVRWLNEPEQQATWHEGTGYIPIRTDAAELPQVQELWGERPQYRVPFEQLVEAGAPFGGPVIGNYKDFREAIVTSLERMMLQGQSPADALAQADANPTRAIQQYNDRVS
jgi:sn-glycerol 3-phosphate transport system substrate-binding protein